MCKYVLIRGCCNDGKNGCGFGKLLGSFLCRAECTGRMFILKFWSKLRIVHCPFCSVYTAGYHNTCIITVLHILGPGGGRLADCWQWLSVMEYRYPIKYFGQYCHVAFQTVSCCIKLRRFFVSGSHVSPTERFRRLLIRYGKPRYVNSYDFAHCCVYHPKFEESYYSRKCWASRCNHHVIILNHKMYAGTH